MRVAEHRAGRDDAFLVGERDGRAARDGGERGLDRGGAHDRDHHDVGRARRRVDDRRAAGGDFDAGAGEAVLQLARSSFSSPMTASFGPDGARLLDQHLDIATAR